MCCLRHKEWQITVRILEGTQAEATLVQCLLMKQLARILLSEDWSCPDFTERIQKSHTAGDHGARMVWMAAAKIHASPSQINMNISNFFSWPARQRCMLAHQSPGFLENPVTFTLYIGSTSPPTRGNSVGHPFWRVANSPAHGRPGT